MLLRYPNSKLNIQFKNSLFLLIIIVIVCAIRFDRNDFFIDQYTGAEIDSDAVEYIVLVESFRGQAVGESPTAPFTYRPLVPFIASFIPLPAMTSINVVNILALWLSAIFLSRILIDIGLTRQSSNIVLALYLVSFPVFYYGAIGYLDPALIGSLGIGCYLIHRKLAIPLMLLFFVGSFIKESVIILVPVFFIQGLVEKRNLLHLSATTIIMVCIFLAGLYTARYISIDQSTYVWYPSTERFVNNISRIRTWISFFLTLGLIGLLAFSALIITIKTRNWTLLLKMAPWITGMAGSLALFVYGLLSAYADGRMVWPALVFAIPLIGMFIKEHEAKFSKFLPSS